MLASTFPAIGDRSGGLGGMVVMRKALFVLSWGLLVACSSNSSGTSTPSANPCATKNATYLETLTQVSGNCGPIASQVVNISAEGTVVLPAQVTCASLTETGCTTRATDCTLTTQGVTFTETFESTFASDGSSATGIVTLTGSANGGSCTSTYDITMTRQ
jgi:hypothetical protein